MLSPERLYFLANKGNWVLQVFDFRQVLGYADGDTFQSYESDFTAMAAALVTAQCLAACGIV